MCGRVPTFQDGPKPGSGRLWNDRFVGLDHVNLGTQFAQFARDHIAGDPGSGQQHALPRYVITQALDHRLGDVLFGDDIYFNTAFLDRLLGSGSDGRYFQVLNCLLVKPSL